MHLRDWLPWRNLVIQTSLPPNMAAAELDKYIGERRFFGGGDLPLVGRGLGERRFRFSPRGSYRRAPLPVITAAVTAADPGGSDVHIRMRPTVASVLFLAVWMLIAIFVAPLSRASSAQRGAPVPLFVLLVVAPVAGSVSVAFEMQRAERLLRTIFAEAPR